MYEVELQARLVRSEQIGPATIFIERQVRSKLLPPAPIGIPPCLPILRKPRIA